MVTDLSTELTIFCSSFACNTRKCCFSTISVLTASFYFLAMLLLIVIPA